MSLPLPRSSHTLRRLAAASLVSQVGIVVTGGAVRLTGSGLGCPTFPRCTETSLVNTPAYGVHGYIEFGNRLLTFVLAAIALATLVSALLQRPRRAAVVRLATALLLGIPAQALIGGVTVLTQLNPWVVMLHFMLSAVLVAMATALLRRVDEGDDAPRPVASPWLRRHATVVLAVTFATIYVGTVVTGSGPHAGDAASSRTGLDVASVSQLHADLVFLLLGLSLGLLVLTRALDAPRRTRRAAEVLVGLEVAQGAIGFTQYATDLPVLLVGLHMLGAALLAAAATDAWLATRDRGLPPAVADAPRGTVPAREPAPA